MKDKFPKFHSINRAKKVTFKVMNAKLEECGKESKERMSLKDIRFKSRQSGKKKLSMIVSSLMKEKKSNLMRLIEKSRSR
jgi:hypothetical protein